MLIFISGAVRSGKSQYGERLAEQLVHGNRQLTYVATAYRTDVDMEKRITLHQHERKQRAEKWKTVERPLNLEQVLSMRHKNEIVLIDCLTTWLSNEMYPPTNWREHSVREENICARIISAIQVGKQKSKALIVISNDVFSDVLIDDPFVFRYVRLLGNLHQRIVQMADQAIAMEAGVAIVKKGVTKT